MATRNSGSKGRSTSSAKNQIIEMLKADHKKVKKAFKDFEKLQASEDTEACEALVEQTCAELEVHTTLEEQLFYPAARDSVKEADLLDEAEVEHMSAKVLIEQLKGMSASDDKFAATFKVLGEYVNHHIKEEEGELFKQLGGSADEWSSVLEQMQQQRVLLLEEKGLPAEEEAEGEAMASEGDTSRSPSSRASSGARASSRSEGEARPQAASRTAPRSGSKE